MNLKPHLKVFYPALSGSEQCIHSSHYFQGTRQFDRRKTSITCAHPALAHKSKYVYIILSISRTNSYADAVNQ